MSWAVRNLSARMNYAIQTTSHSGSALQICLYSAVVLVAIVGATAVTVIHAWITRRLTFFLFRLYASCVSAGVGLLSGYALAFAVNANSRFGPEWNMSSAALLCLFISVTLALFVYRHASQFRADRPELMNPVSPEEYGGLRTASNIDDPRAH